MKLVFLCLLSLCSACHTNPLKSLEHSLGVSNLQTFKRQAQQERRDLTDKPNWDRPLLLKDLAELGFVNAIRPNKQHYQTAVVLGSTGPAMQSRIAYLIDLWNLGTRFDRVVFLTGDRILDERDRLSNPGLAKNETQLFKKLWAQANLPEILKQLPTRWIDAPKIQSGRPTTVSTIEAWRRQENLDHEDILAISNQPFIDYQQCALLNYLPDTASVETVGPAANPDALIAVYLDALASCLEHCPGRSKFQHRLSTF